MLNIYLFPYVKLQQLFSVCSFKIQNDKDIFYCHFLFFNRQIKSFKNLKAYAYELKMTNCHIFLYKWEFKGTIFFRLIKKI